MRTFREKNKFNKTVLWLTLISFVSQPLLVSAKTIADNSNPSATPVIDQTVNGTELVHIAKPHTDGVSRNLYQDFNVSTNGLILNNNATNGVVSTSRGEGVIPNFNFQGGDAASVILNEVTGVNLSNLLGDLEVAGTGAELIIANENGITCNGCGFINSTQTTLTTGKTVFDNSGNLTAYRVTDGMIDIGEDGLDANLSQSLNLLANGINVNGPVWADTLNVVSGRNDINSENLTNTKIQGELSSTPLIDIGSLGGMYANQIFLVTTGEGTGVNNSGEIGTSVGDLIITSDGLLKSRGIISSKSSINLTGAEIDNAGTISSQTNISMQTDSVKNTGIVTSLQNIGLNTKGLNNEGVLTSLGTTEIKAKGNVSNNGEINSALAMSVSALNIDNFGKISIEKDGITLNAQQTINNADNASIIVQSDNAVITSAGEINNDGVIYLENGNGSIINQSLVSNTGDIHLEAGSLDISSQVVLENLGRINIESGDLSISSQQNINNTGKINVKGGNAIIAVQQNLTNTGEIISDAGKLSISASKFLNSGDISSKGNQSIVSDLENTGLIVSKADLTITSQEMLSNNGIIASDGLMEIASVIVENAINGRIISKNIFNLTVTDFNNQNDISFVGGIWDAQIWFNQGDIQNIDNGFVLNSGSIDNAGTLNGINSNLTLTSETTLLNSGKIKSEKGVSLEAVGDINNSGIIASRADMVIHSDAKILNSSNSPAVNAILEADNIDLLASQIINESIIKSAGNIDLVAHQQFINKDRLTLAGNLIVDTYEFSNSSQAKISSGKDISLISNNFSNEDNATIVAGTGNINIATSSLNDNSFNNNGRLETLQGDISLLLNGNTIQDGEIISATDIYFFSGITGLDVQDGTVTLLGQTQYSGSLLNRGVIQSGGNSEIGFNRITNNERMSSKSGSSFIYSLGSITNTKEIYGQNGLTIFAEGAINNNADSAITSLDYLEINSTNNIYNRGFIVGNQQLDIDSHRLENLDGFISGGYVTINVNGFKNDATSGLFSTNKIDVESGTGGISNYGEIYSFSDLDLTLDAAGMILNAELASIKSKGNMLLGVDCAGGSPCNVNFETTFDNRSLVQSDLSLNINSYTFINQIDVPPLGDWRTTSYKQTNQKFSGRYSCSSIFCHTRSWGYYFELSDAYKDWRRAKTEYRQVDYSLVSTLPRISVGSNLVIHTNDGKNQGGVLEARNNLTMELLDVNRAGSFTNTAITTSETKKSYEEGRYRASCDYQFPASCKYHFSKAATESNGWKHISTKKTTKGGLIKAGTISVMGSISGKKIAFKNENGATDTEGTVRYSGVGNKNLVDTPTVNFINSTEINNYADTIPELGKLPDDIQSVGSAIGIDIDFSSYRNKVGNDLFIESTAPDREFLYELNPRIPTNNSTQVGTDYLLQQMDVDIGNILRLGDASYEQEIIEQQIAIQASARWITGAETAGEQLTILMDNGVEFADANGLLVGESLSDEQIQNLDKDLVWLEYSYVGDEIVLVPVVYLSQETKKHSAGAILAESIQMDLDTLTNDGGTIEATGDATIIAQGNIENIGGTISTDNLAIASTKGSIINESVIHRIGTEDNYEETATQALISANNDLILSANQNIDILGSNIQAGNSAIIHTENGDVNVTSLVLESKSTSESHSKTGLFSSEHTKTVTVEQTQQTVGINVGGNMSPDGSTDDSSGGLLIYAESGAVNLTGADINSIEDIAIFADDVVTSTLELYNFTSNETHSSGFTASGGGIGVYSNDHYSSSAAGTASGTNINAGGNLLVDATNDIKLEGGSINATNGSFNAGNNFTTVAAADTESTREFSSESQAGIQVGDGSISGSASNTTSSATTDSTLYSNVNMTFEDGVSITARDTVEMGGLDLAVVNVAEDIEPEPQQEPNNENTELVGNAELVEPESDEVESVTGTAISDPRTQLNISALVAEVVDGSSTITTLASLTNEALSEIQPEIALGSATISGDKVISTKFENTFSETSSTSTTVVGFSAGASDNGDGTSSVNASVGGGTSSASSTTDILAENMNNISAGDLIISGKESIDLVGVNLVGEDSVSLESEGDISIIAAKYVESLTSESSDNSFGISAGITVANGKESSDEATDGPITNPLAPPASASIGVAFSSSNASSDSNYNGHVDSSIVSNGDVSIQSGDGDITFTGVALQADKAAIEGNSFTAAAYEDSFESSESSTQVGISLTASTDLAESANSLFQGNGMQHSDYDTVGTQEVGNTLVANELTIDVKNDATIVGGDISAAVVDIKAHTVDLIAAKATLEETKNESGISLVAGGSAALGGEKAWVNVDSMKDGVDTGTSSSSGLADRTNDGRNNGGKAISDELLSGKVGLNITSRTEETSTTTYTNANIQFENLNIDTTNTTHSDDGHVDIGGANLVAFTGEDGEPRTSSIDITSGELKTTKYVDTMESTVTDTSTFVGVVAEGHSAIADTYNHEMTAQKKAEEGMSTDQGMRNAQHAADGMNMLMGDAAGGSASAAIKNSVTITNTSSTSENINYVNADNISITATEGNIDLKGVEFNAPPTYNEDTGEMEANDGPRAQSIALNAKQDVNIEAAKSTFSQTSTTVTTDLTLTASASVSATGSGVGVDAGYNGSINKDSLEKTTYSNAQLNADNVTITSKNLALTGANVNGGNIDINVANDINVTSVQDTQTQSTERANWGASAGVNTLTLVSGSVQGGGGNSHDNYQKTAQQSGINAENSLNVEAGNNLTLTGASIGVAEGGTGSVTAKTITANKLEDKHDKDGLFAGGGFGVDQGGVNANFNVETVDKIDQQTTQNSTINGVAINTEQPIQGDNLTASGELQTDSVTEIKNERVAGVYLNSSASTTGTKQLARNGNSALNTASSAKNTLVGATSAAANKIVSKQAVVTAPPFKKGKGTESVVVVIPANKGGEKTDVVVQEAANAVASKQENKDRNVIVVKENQDGSLQVAKGDVSTIKGDTKIDVVSHGSTLKDKGADSVATLIKKVADETGLTDKNKNSDLTKVTLTACGDCNKTDGQTIGIQITKKLADEGLEPRLKEHDSKVQVQQNGTVVALNNSSKLPKTLTHKVKDGIVVTDTKTKTNKHLTNESLQKALANGDDDNQNPTNGQWANGEAVAVKGLPVTMNMSHENTQQAQARIDNFNNWLPVERKIIQQTQADLKNHNSNVYKQSSHMVHDQRGEIARQMAQTPMKPLTDAEVSTKVKEHKKSLGDAEKIQLKNEINNTGKALYVHKLVEDNDLAKFTVDKDSDVPGAEQHARYIDKTLNEHNKTLNAKEQAELVNEISSIGQRLIAERLQKDEKRKENVDWVINKNKRAQDGSEAYKETMALMASGAEGPLTMGQSAQGAQAAAAGYQLLSKEDKTLAKQINDGEITQDSVPTDYANRQAVNEMVPAIKAVRDKDPETGKPSHPSTSKHGVILANDPGTISRDNHGLAIMTGTSGTTASMTRSVIRSRVSNEAAVTGGTVDKQFVKDTSIAAKGLSESEANNAMKDLALTWMREGAFATALKKNIDKRLEKTDPNYVPQNDDLNRVQTHTYGEIAEGFDRTVNFKNDDKRSVDQQIEASSVESLNRLNANKPKYDSAIVVVTRDTNGEISKAVQDSADDIKRQYPDTVVLKQNEDGSVDVGENAEKLKDIKGDTRIDVIGHGSDLKEKGATEVAGIIDKVASDINANDNETNVKRAEIVACGDCAKPGDKTFGQKVVEEMETKNLTVAEHNSAIQVSSTGERQAKAKSGKQAQKILTTKNERGEVTTARRAKTEVELAKTLDPNRELSNSKDGDAETNNETTGHWVKSIEDGQPVYKPVAIEGMNFTMNATYKNTQEALDRVNDLNAWLPTERKIIRETQAGLKDPNSNVFKQSSHMVHQQRGEIFRHLNDPATNEGGVASDQRRQENIAWVTDIKQRAQDDSAAYKETMDLMASGAAGPLTMEQSAQGAQAAAAGYQLFSKDDKSDQAKIKEVTQDAKDKNEKTIITRALKTFNMMNVFDGVLKDRENNAVLSALKKDTEFTENSAERHAVNTVVVPVKATRNKDEAGKASHPKTSPHGVDLSSDLGTQSRQQNKLGVMTGTSGTTSSMTRSAIRAQVTNDNKAITAKSIRNTSLAAKGLTDEQAHNAMKDLALTWMRDGAFATALKDGINERLEATDPNYTPQNSDLDRVQTHSYGEIAEGFDRTLNSKNGDTRSTNEQINTSSLNTIDRLTENKSIYDSAVVVVTRDKNGEISKAVQDSADDIKRQYPDTIVLKQNADGTVDVGENADKLKNIKGDTRIDVIGHGSDLKEKGATEVAGIIDKIASDINANDNETNVKRAEIVACGDCAKQGDKTFGQKVVEEMDTKNLTVAEHNSAIQVSSTGKRQAVNDASNQPKKIFSVKNEKGEITTTSRPKKDAELVRRLDNDRVLMGGGDIDIRPAGDDEVGKKIFGDEEAMINPNDYGFSETDSDPFVERRPRALRLMKRLENQYIESDPVKIESARKARAKRELEEANALKKEQEWLEKSEEVKAKNMFKRMAFKLTNPKPKKAKKKGLQITDLPPEMSLNFKKVLVDIAKYRGKNEGLTSMTLDQYKAIFKAYNIDMPFDVHQVPGSSTPVSMMILPAGYTVNSLKTEKIWQSLVAEGFQFELLAKGGSGPHSLAMASAAEGKHRRTAFTRIFEQLNIPTEFRMVPADDEYE